MWFALETPGLPFIKTAPYVLENEAILDVSPERAFEVFATAENQRVWFQDFVACRWTTPPEHDVGAERDIELKLMTASERFLIWEPGRRLTFMITAMTLPVVSAMIEDMQFEPHGEGKTRFTWRAHYAPKRFLVPVHPILRGVFGKMFTASTKGYEAYVASHPKRG